MTTENIIIKKCKELEEEHNIKILFCVESGSRAWKLDSKDSDYDIRFVYHRPIKEYLKISQRKEVITTNYDKKGNKTPSEGCYLDFTGFDIYKFARMLNSSNPTVIEWLISDIIYYGKQNKAFKNYAKTQSKPISLYFHYKSMCKNNYLKYLKTKNLVTYKKYLYATRGLLNAKWVANKKKIPPISFPELINEINPIIKKAKFPKIAVSKEIIPTYILKRVSDIIYLKRESKEKDIIQNIPEIDNYIETFLKDDTEAPKQKKLGTNKELDDEVMRIIGV